MWARAPPIRNKLRTAPESGLQGETEPLSGEERATALYVRTVEAPPSRGSVSPSAKRERTVGKGPISHWKRDRLLPGTGRPSLQAAPREEAHCRSRRTTAACERPHVRTLSQARRWPPGAAAAVGLSHSRAYTQGSQDASSTASLHETSCATIHAERTLGGTRR